MGADKKARRGQLRFVLVDCPGKVEAGCEVPDTVLREAFDRLKTG
jgi:hypothetical protein